MTKNKNNSLAMESEEWFHLSLHEITYTFNVQPEIIIEIINEGIVTVPKDKNNEWQFDGESLRRIRTVLHLQRDLGVNLAGAALAIELLDKIDSLYKKLGRR